MISREELFAYVKETYDIAPDYPWARTPNYAILRHKNSRKWFGAVIDITKDKLGLPEKQPADVLNLKCDPLLTGSLLDRANVFPGYHMNKEHWITVLMSGSLPRDTLLGLVDLSYRLTK